MKIRWSMMTLALASVVLLGALGTARADDWKLMGTKTISSTNAGADITAEGGCQLVAPHEAHRELGHLDGWGRGLFDGTAALGHMQSRGSTSAKTAAWVLRGKGRVKVRVGSCRVGYIEKAIDIA